MQAYQSYKELIIRKPTPCRMPVFDLNGKWLTDIGFTIGELVYADFRNGCLTLTTDQAARSNIGILVVKGKRVRGCVRPQILLDGFMLKRLGYTSFDRVGLTLEYGKIQIQKIVQYTTADCS